jgi:hypothetical protein
MNHGIDVALRGDFQGAAFRLDRKWGERKKRLLSKIKDATMRWFYTAIIASSAILT